jgi:hypothetical protein
MLLADWRRERRDDEHPDSLITFARQMLSRPFADSKYSRILSIANLSLTINQCDGYFPLLYYLALSFTLKEL